MSSRITTVRSGVSKSFANRASAISGYYTFFLVDHQFKLVMRTTDVLGSSHRLELAYRKAALSRIAHCAPKLSVDHLNPWSLEVVETTLRVGPKCDPWLNAIRCAPLAGHRA